MTSKTKPTKAKALAALQAIIAGTQKHLPNESFTFGNVAYTSAALITLFESVIAAMAEHTTKATAAKDALTALHQVKVTADPVFKDYRDQLLLRFGSASQMLADFGLAPPKARKPLTVEQKAAAKAKRKATRLAHGKSGAAAGPGNAAATTATAETPPAAPAGPPAKPVA